MKSHKALILYYSTHSVCGVGTWVEAVSEALTSRGWDVTVGLAWGRKFHNPLTIESVRPGLKTLWMDGRTGTEEGRITAIIKTIRHTKPDVVLLTCLDSAFEAVRRARNQGMNFRFISVNHGTLPIQAACFIQNQDTIDIAVCVSRLSFRVLSTWFDNSEQKQLRHIPNAVAVPENRPVREFQYRVGYAGRLDADKNSDKIIPFYHKLHKIHPSSQLWIAGKGNCENEIQSLAQNYPENVRYFGRLSKKELYENFYPNLDTFVHFAPYEGWPYTIAEAMAHGVVPVTSNFRGLVAEGLVREGQNALLFPPLDVDGAVELVRNLFENPERWKQLSEQAVSDIRAQFSLNQFGDVWSETISHAMSLTLRQGLREPLSLNLRNRFGIREIHWEYLRRLLRRRVPHATARSEWPHFKCDNKELIDRISAMMDLQEQVDRAHPSVHP